MTTMQQHVLLLSNHSYRNTIDNYYSPKLVHRRNDKCQIVFNITTDNNDPQYLLSMRRYDASDQKNEDVFHETRCDDVNMCNIGEKNHNINNRRRFPYWLPVVQATSLSTLGPPVSISNTNTATGTPHFPATSTPGRHQLTSSSSTCNNKNTSPQSDLTPSKLMDYATGSNITGHVGGTSMVTSMSAAVSTNGGGNGSTATTTNRTAANASAHNSVRCISSVRQAQSAAHSVVAARCVNLMSNTQQLPNSFMLPRFPPPPTSSSSPVINVFTPYNFVANQQSPPPTDNKTNHTGDQHPSSSSPPSDSGHSPSASESTRTRPPPSNPPRHSLIYDSFDQPPRPYKRLPSLQSRSFHPSVSSAAGQEQSEQPQQANNPDSFLLIHHQFHHLTLAEKERFERLFREIDVNDNGFIDFNDLVSALERKGIRATHDNVKHVIDRSDTNLDGDIDFAEFVNYCLENEKKLHILFKDIDLNADGKIDADELVHAFERVGIEVDNQEAIRLVHRIKGKDGLKSRNKLPGSVELDFNEFRDYLLLHPTDSLSNLMRSWRHGTFVDLGEDGLMPVDFNETEIRSGMWWRHLIAGGVAGAVSRTATAPLDRLKVFLQVRGAEFNGLGVCLRHMLHEGGTLSLWRGNGINVLKIAPETAIKFMAFDQLKRWIHSNKASGEITIMERFLAGSLAGAISQTVIYPMEVLKTRFCLRSTGQYKGLFDAASKITAQGGIRNFYRGYVPNLLGIIPYAGIDLTIYETLKKMYLKHNALEEAPIFVCLACGTMSSTFGQVASYPLALVRTRMQSELGYHQSSMVNMFKTIYRKEGPKGLYRGITANIMKVAPAVSISYVVYEYTRRPLGAIMT